jgi:4-amino-4-deoxy-L-arabinose transferase-like glycosyltransferase
MGRAAETGRVSSRGRRRNGFAGATHLNRKTIVALILVTAFALAARVVFLGFVVGLDRAPAGDEIDYHHIASNLAEGEGFRLENGQLTARRPPLYPVVLSGVYRIYGESPAVGRIFQIILGVSIVPLVFFMTRRFFAAGSAWIASWLVALNPFLIFSGAYLLTENLYILLLLAGAWAASGALTNTSGARRAVVGGVLLGLADLARPTASLVAVWIALAVLFFGEGRAARRAPRAALLVAALFVTLLPWAARNHDAFGKWIFSTTHGGITFYQGNNPAVLEYPQYHGGVAPLHMLPGYDDLRKKPEIEKDEAARSMGREFLLRNKSDVPVLVWRKFARFWRFKSDSGLSGVKSGWWWSKESALGRAASSLDAGMVYALFVIPLFVAGLFAGWKGGSRRLLLGGIVVVHTFVSLVFHGSLRMRIPIEPVIAMFAADAVWRLVTRIRMRRARV